eukprot:Hpha_TRINITY_DN37281_c0_g1::TRINITY_DN37281_c0_g1_i1::g.85258::m.85258
MGRNFPLWCPLPLAAIVLAQEPPDCNDAASIPQLAAAVMNCIDAAGVALDTEAACTAQAPQLPPRPPNCMWCDVPTAPAPPPATTGGVPSTESPSAPSGGGGTASTTGGN